MKRSILFLVLQSLILFSWSQAPPAFNYQAVTRDLNGEILQSQNVGLRLSILSDSLTGNSIYQEIHSPTTNQFGLITIAVGEGIVISGDFDTIDWGGSSKFLQVEMDATGGTNYSLMGVSPLLSVPFALYAETTGDSSIWLKGGNDIHYSSGNVGIKTANPVSSLHTVGELTIQLGSNQTPYEFFQLKDSTGNQRLRMQMGYTPSISQLNIDIPPTDSVGSSTIRFFRYTNTSGNKWVRFYKGEGSTLSSAQIGVDGNHSYFQGNGLGNFGIGTKTPQQKLHVVGNICYTGSIGACSDLRYKTGIAPIYSALSSLIQLRGISYYWRQEQYPENSFPDTRQLGFIAQEVENLFPELVLSDSQGFKSVDYAKLTPVLVEAIKEQQAEIEELKQRLDLIEKHLSK